MSWHLYVFDFDAPTLPESGDPRWPLLHEYLQTWRTYVGEPRGGNGDFEDWVEQAARLHAGVSAFDDVQVHVHGKNTVTVPGKVWGSLTLRPGVHVPQRALADTYARSAAFQALSGRELHVVRGDEVDDVVRSLDNGIDAIWIKVNRAKYALVRLAADEVAEFLAGHTEDAQDLGYAKVHLEDEEGAFMVYREVAMHYEMRFFMVDGIPVTSAGCIEAHTPLDNLTRFDAQVTHVRSSSDVEHRPSLVERLRVFAEQAGQRLLAEGFRHYVLDVALGAQGPLVIEINDLLNAGLYACDPLAITQAMASSPEPIVAKPYTRGIQVQALT